MSLINKNTLTALISRVLLESSTPFLFQNGDGVIQSQLNLSFMSVCLLWFSEHLSFCRHPRETKFVSSSLFSVLFNLAAAVVKHKLNSDPETLTKDKILNWVTNKCNNIWIFSLSWRQFCLFSCKHCLTKSFQMLNAIIVSKNNYSPNFSWSFIVSPYNFIVYRAGFPDSEWVFGVWSVRLQLGCDRPVGEKWSETRFHFFLLVQQLCLINCD